jgi:FkbM family methyltransferase
MCTTRSRIGLVIAIAVCVIRSEYIFSMRSCLHKEMHSLPQAVNSPYLTMNTIDYNVSMVIQPVFSFRKNDAINEMTCAAEGAIPFFMHCGLGSANDWVCNNNGEQRVTAVMLHVFQGYCQTNKYGAGGLVLDVGANAGYYGLMALKMGCRALFFDLQPGCHRFINNAIVINQFTNNGRVVPYGVSSTYASFKVPSGQCQGRYPQEAREKNIFGQGDAIARVHPLTTFIGLNQLIAMIKIDTEGNERDVLQGSLHHFSNHLVRNAIVEVSPGAGFWDRLNITRLEVADTFAKVASYGYKLISLWDWTVYNSTQEVHFFVMQANFIQSDVLFTIDDFGVEVLDAIKN